ncbi:MAG TPA: MgtC/SapB family protein [Candidatus Paceibacterota bacterium]
MSFLAQLSLLVPLVVATALGLLLGLERTLAGKHAGMRTYAMVSLGSALFTLTGVVASYQLAVFSGINPLQVAGSVVIGIGFIGTGLAAFRGDHPVELTTASGIWVASAVGMACGFGMYTVAVGTTILAFIILSVLLRLENGLRRRYDIRD